MELSGYNSLFSGSEPIEVNVPVSGPVEIQASPNNGANMVHVGSSDVDAKNGFPIATKVIIMIAFIANLNQHYYYGSSPVAISWVIRRL